MLSVMQEEHLEHYKHETYQGAKEGQAGQPGQSGQPDGASTTSAAFEAAINVCISFLAAFGGSFQASVLNLISPKVVHISFDPYSIQRSTCKSGSSCGTILSVTTILRHGDKKT